MLKSRHWLGAIAVAFFMHGALAYVFFYNASPQSGALAEGVGGLEISITMIAAAQGAEAQTEVKETPQQIEEPEVVDKPIEPEPDPVVEEEVVDTPEPIDEPEPVEQIVETAPISIPKPRIKPVVNAPKKPAIQKKQPPKQIVTKPAPVKKHEPARPKQLANLSQGSTQNAPKANRMDTTTHAGGGVVANVRPDYITKLRYWLEKHKTYPRRAKRRHQEGVVVLTFTVNRDGRVSNYRIKQKSGYKALDQETLAMLERAQPLPKFPAEMKQDKLHLTLPIQFALR